MNIILILATIAIFVWIFSHSNGGNFTSIKKELTFNDVLYSEYGYIMALVAKMAKSDGRVSELEVEFIENILNDICDSFENKDDARIHLKLIFKEEKEVQDNVDFVAAALYDAVKSEPYKLQKILEFLVNLAFIDGELHENEKRILFEVAHAFKVQEQILDDIFDNFANFNANRTKNSQHKSIEEYYQLLGVTRDCSDKELKSAYRKGVKEHHPDVIMGKGGSEEDIKESTGKMQAFNDAYEAIKKQRA